MAHFTKDYAQLYDWLYGEKSYDVEVDLIQKTISELRPGSNVILDYGCGTGNHAKVLLEKGYRIFGVDVNREMLGVAQRKLSDKNVKFLHVSERDNLQPGSVDVCVCLFDVLSYMNSNQEILGFLSFVKKVLAKDGLLFVDFWYGPGVTQMGPEKRWKEFQKGDQRVLRLTSPEHDVHKCTIHVTHKVFVFRDDKVLTLFEELHSMRYFYAQEIELFLTKSGFRVGKFGTWNSLDVPPTTNDWSALVVAQTTKDID